MFSRFLKVVLMAWRRGMRWFVLPFLFVVFGFIAYAAPSVRVPHPAPNFFVRELPDDINNSCAYDLFVPLQSQAERDSFVNNKPGCAGFNWSQTFWFSGSGNQSFSFWIPWLENVISAPYSISNVLGGVGGSVGFGGVFVNQPQYTSASISVNGSYLVVVDSFQYGFDENGQRYLVSGTGYATINGQNYPVIVDSFQYGFDENGQRYLVSGTGYATINGQNYPVIVDSFQYGFDENGQRYLVSGTGRMDVSFSGSLTVSGKRRVSIPAIIGPVTGIGWNGGGTFLCPSGTFVYGWNADTQQHIRNDGGHIILREIYCADSFGATMDNIVRTIPAWPGSGGICAQGEYIKGFHAIQVQADNLPYSILDTIYCAQLAAPSPQAGENFFNMLAYNNGNSYQFSSRLGPGDGPRAIVGLIGISEWGPADAIGPRFNPYYFYSRAMPTMP